MANKIVKTASKLGLGCLSTAVGAKTFQIVSESLVKTDTLNEMTAAGAVGLSIQAGVGTYMIGNEILEAGFRKLDERKEVDEK